MLRICFQEFVSLPLSLLETLRRLAGGSTDSTSEVPKLSSLAGAQLDGHLDSCCRLPKILTEAEDICSGSPDLRV